MSNRSIPAYPRYARLAASLGERLRLARLRRRLTATEMAERMGVTRVTLGRLERGDLAVGLGVLVRALGVLGLEEDLAELASNDDLGRRLVDAGELDEASSRRIEMRSSELDHVMVELDSAELRGPVDIGVLRRTRAAGGSIVGFAYSDDWLSRKDSFAIDPLHGLYPGDQWPRDGKIDRIFADAATDRWGRTLLSRQEAHTARTEKRPRRMLDEWDYLLGISDVSRMGALRLRAPNGRYVDDADDVPPMTRLPELVAAAREIESPSGDSRRQALSLALLLAPGSSLGGARPKASFLDQDGSLWMAKFPSRTDTRDMAACEWVLNELAAAAGIDVPEHRLLEVRTGQHSFLARRFDRVGGSRRLYASAMTLLSRLDRDEASYLDIALAIADHGEPSAIESELTAMFRRVVFNVLTAHRDDHLRNHGFLRTATGWFLAPAFDLNPMPDMPEHTLAIDMADHIGDIDLVLSTAEFYRLSSAQAEAVVDEVRAALVRWERTAKSAKLGPDEMETIAEALGT